MPRADASPAVSVERFFQLALLGLVACGFLAVAGSGYLDSYTIALTTAAFILRALAVCGAVKLNLSERAITLITTAYAGFFLADFFLLSRELLRSAVHLVFFLAVIKILTARVSRDYAYIAAIAFMELLAAALLSIDFNFFASLTFYVLFAIAALTGAEIRRSIGHAPATARSGSRRFHPRLALLSTLIALGILGITGGFFFILPRTADAAFLRFAHRTILPAFSNQMKLGQIGEIKNTSQPVMHIDVFSARPDAPLNLKWRGAALVDFDGRNWSNLAPRPRRVPFENGHAVPESSRYTGGATHLSYHVDFDALDSRTLFFAGLPEQIDLRYPGLSRNQEGSYTLDYPPPPGFHYEAYSRLDTPPETSPPPYPAPILGLADRERYLQLPPRLDARIPALARSLAEQARTDLERARAVERRLRRDYGYSLQLSDREVADPLAYFLFTRRKGYCEYFASAMTVMLRSLGIPARIVTGFQSGEYNPLTRLWVVRASDAHSWVEAWMPGYGWSTFDPTPSDPNAREFALLDRLGLYLDAAQTFWQDWVVGYDTGRQGTLAERVERGARRLGIGWADALDAAQSGWRAYSATVTRGVLIRIGVVAGMGLWIWLLAPPLIRLLRMRQRVERARRGQASMVDATLLYHRMLQILKRRGYQKPAWFTPSEFAASLPPGPAGAAVAEFTLAYNALRFGGQTGVAPRLSLLLDELEHQT
ncbi:MAG: DUF3488 and transglutaminase-like domain-containing protein [Acidobacteriia bacterium]|nr:DUF3488 and transglutaminase-like domain-containing protein [Terriglobia bacterium]